MRTINKDLKVFHYQELKIGDVVAYPDPTVVGGVAFGIVWSEGFHLDTSGERAGSIGFSVSVFPMIPYKKSEKAQTATLLGREPKERHLLLHDAKYLRRMGLNGGNFDFDLKYRYVDLALIQSVTGYGTNHIACVGSIPYYGDRTTDLITRHAFQTLGHQVLRGERAIDAERRTRMRSGSDMLSAAQGSSRDRDSGSGNNLPAIREKVFPRESLELHRAKKNGGNKKSAKAAVKAIAGVPAQILRDETKKVSKDALDAWKQDPWDVQKMIEAKKLRYPEVWEEVCALYPEEFLEVPLNEGLAFFDAYDGEDKRHYSKKFQELQDYFLKTLDERARLNFIRVLESVPEDKEAKAAGDMTKEQAIRPFYSCLIADNEARAFEEEHPRAFAVVSQLMEDKQGAINEVIDEIYASDDDNVKLNALNALLSASYRYHLKERHMLPAPEIIRLEDLPEIEEAQPKEYDITLADLERLGFWKADKYDAKPRDFGSLLIHPAAEEKWPTHVTKELTRLNETFRLANWWKEALAGCFVGVGPTIARELADKVKRVKAAFDKDMAVLNDPAASEADKDAIRKLYDGALIESEPDNNGGPA